MGASAIDVVYENGVFRPIQPVSLPERSRARVYAAGAADEPVISKTPGVCGGRACIAGTRISVWGLVAYRRLGLDDAAIQKAIPGLTQEQLGAAFRYVDEHPDEIDRDVAENEDGE